MHNGQLDLFSEYVPPTSPPQRQIDEMAPPDASALTDEALVAAIPNASIAQSRLLTGEAARRRMKTAIPALEELCRRFIGFGSDSLVPEQVAALEALSKIGGGEAVQAVVRVLVRKTVQGPTLAVAVAAAARLKAILPKETALQLLRNANPLIRANAARCARSQAATLPALVDLLADLHEQVRIAAACALGRMGRAEARPMLIRLLREAPNAEVIDASPSIADDACCVLLGRIARSGSGLASLALDALDVIDDPRAEHIIAAIRDAERKSKIAPSANDTLGSSQAIGRTAENA
jgi:HEAT repeat protein